MGIEILGDEVRNHPEFDEHFAVLRKRFTDNAYGIIAIHRNMPNHISTGGTRRGLFSDPFAEGLPLSRGMTYKIRTADIPWGGGAKGVLVADPEAPDADDIVREYAKFVNELGGLFYTGEDMNMHVRQIDIMAEITPYVLGRSSDKRHKDGLKGGGDPSLSTAYGVFLGIQECLQATYGTRSVRNFTYCISGLGSTGLPIATWIYDAGGYVYLADWDEKKIERALACMRDKDRVKVLDWRTAHKKTVDVFVPCAGGNIINEETQDEFDCRIVAGSANCIFTRRHAYIADYFHLRRGILIAPDYVINAGGLIHIYHESIGFNSDAVKWDVEKISDRLGHIFKISKESGRIPHRIADEMVALKTIAEEKKRAKK